MLSHSSAHCEPHNSSPRRARWLSLSHCLVRNRLGEVKWLARDLFAKSTALPTAFIKKPNQSSSDPFLVHCPTTVSQRTAWEISWWTPRDQPSTPQCSSHWPSADKGRFGPWGVKHITGNILCHGAQNLSKANCRSSRIPASLCNGLGTTRMSTSKTAAPFPFRNKGAEKRQISNLGGAVPRGKEQDRNGETEKGWREQRGRRLEEFGNVKEQTTARRWEEERRESQF